VIEIQKPVLVQAFIPKFAIKALHVTIINRFTRADEMQPDPMCISPGIHGVADELRTIVYTQQRSQSRPPNPVE
jgi:hypothetical protein